MSRPSPDPGLLVREPPDLRLLVPSTAAWLAAAVGDQVGAGFSQPAAAGLLLFGGVALVGLRRPTSLVASAALWCAAGALLAASLGVAAAVRGPLPGLAAARATVTLEIVVTGDPHVSAASATESRPTEVIAARAIEVVTAVGATRIRSPIVLLASGYGWSSLQPSQRLHASGRLVSASPGEPEAAVFEARGTPRDVTPPSFVERVAGRIRAGLRAAAAPLPAAPRGLLPGLVDGDTSGLSPELKASFRATGLTHIVAVSGANVAILLGAVLIVARWVGLRLRGQALVGTLAIVGFVVVARPQASVLRAAAMGLIAVAALATGRRARALPSLCAAVLILIMVDPALATSAGFALSVLATAGLVVLAPVIRDRLMLLPPRLPRWLAEAVSVPTAATLMCAPVIVLISGRVSLSSIPANLLAEPAVAPATVLGVLAACTAPLFLPLAKVFAMLGGLPCSWLIFVARSFARLPGSTIGWPSGAGGAFLLTVVMVVLGLVAALCLARWRVRRRGSVRRRVVRVVVGGAVAIGGIAGGYAVRPATFPPPDWVFAVCDVGVGDALVFRAGVDSAVLVDAGPDGALVNSCLRRLKVRHLPVVVLTGFTGADVDGLTGAVADRGVGRIEAAGSPPRTAVGDRLLVTLAVVDVPLSVIGARERASVGTVSYQLTAAARGSLAGDFAVAGITVRVAGDVGTPASGVLAGVQAGGTTLEVDGRSAAVVVVVRGGRAQVIRPR